MIATTPDYKERELHKTILLVLLVVAAFLAGSIWPKWSYLKTQNAGVKPTPSPTGQNVKKVKETFVGYAKNLKLDAKKFQTCMDREETKASIDADIALAATVNATGTPTFFINKTMIVGADTLENFQKLIDAKFVETPDKVLGASNTDTGAPETIAEDAWQTLLQNPAATLGKDDAKVTIVEFTDYQCPFCKRAFDDTFHKLKSQYVDTGKARYLIRDLPLSFHPYAHTGAQAARCAGKQGKYWDMHEKLFTTQATWSSL